MKNLIKEITRYNSIAKENITIYYIVKERSNGRSIELLPKQCLTRYLANGYELQKAINL